MTVTTPFGKASTAAEVLAGVDLGGKRALVTGGASGIGVETARALAAAGAEVTLAARDVTAAARVAAEVKAHGVVPLDLADQGSVRELTGAWEGPLHILVNNAGVMARPLGRSPEGWELQFATNHLGHFALATGLLPALRAAHGARVVSVSSAGHLFSPVVFDDIHFERREYEPWSAYGQSKTANILFAVEANRRWSGDGVLVNALHPGSIQTNLQRYVDAAELQRLRAATGNPNPELKTVEQGAATSALLAGSPLLDGVGGRYFENCNEAGPNQPGTRTGVAAYALDPDAAARLWTISEQEVSR
ncbi:SDR family NAD(P)-dependent oxidoreductase [Dactylosporangium matsuzakiense]|uniref:Probable oxidoreductase n=1 Tax=Dactylosporangium matsuzakiense TaxID=53360 RepID=A0A9W6KEC1_9ACTN|nr:SDR family NAD(P)-dependent oxidoreductase [Dactylosporangium matsuzakiense]UWZ42104.1 SDR family NAD(P)-dependent oxidoreductase [Dactylosporangium matsuzakiense]GLK99732.1 oxidoreductase [Dactylosporangium matsuzakiense]